MDGARFRWRALAGASLLGLAAQGCAAHARCTEFELEAVQRLAEVGVREAGSARLAHRSQPTSSVSEEAAIYAKRLKTLCELLWDDRISLDTYREASNEAYEAYRRSASQRQRVLLPVP